MKKIQWPTAIVLVAVVLAVMSAYLFGPALGVPEESHASLVAGLGVIGSLILANMRGLIAVLKKDKDGDGLPDFLDGKTNPPPATGEPVEDEEESDGVEEGSA